MSGNDLERRMRAGDPSVWPRWDARTIERTDLDAAWRRVFEQRGEPGIPSTIRAYTHFAYCASSCNFCMYWHEVPKREDAYQRHVDHLVRRVDWFRDQFGRQPISSAYCGGGTPTAPPLDQLERYFSAFTAAFEVQGEFTVEGHPGVTTVEKIDLLARHGVNRISMGVQSLADDVLVRITRRNPSVDSISALLRAAQTHGIIVNLDLILGLPEQTLESFRADVQAICDLAPDIVTLYLYEPTRRLNIIPAEEMTYAIALTPELRAAIDDAGFDTPNPLDATTRSYRLVRRPDTVAVDSDDSADSGAPAAPWQDEEATYAQFDATPSHTIAVGPGAYGHVFGAYWYREVTAMTNLEADDPRYFGTALGTVDECRSVMLDAIAHGRPFRPEWMKTVIDVDPAQAFAEGWELGLETGALRLSDTGSELIARFDPGPLTERCLDRIVPALPSTSEPRSVDERHVELALVATRRDVTEVEASRAALDDFRESLRIPPRGHQFCRGVWVGPHDDGSISFFVGSRKADPLRILVAPADPAGAGASFFSTARFSIMYGSRHSGPPTEQERLFLGWLTQRMVAASMRPRPRPTPAPRAATGATNSGS